MIKSTDHNFWRERRAEADSNRGPSAYQPNALPLGQTGSWTGNWALGCFHSLISTEIFRRALTASVDSCAEVKSAASVAYLNLAEFGGRCRKAMFGVRVERTLRASLSGTFLQTLPDLVTPLKGHFISAQLSSNAVSALRKVPVLIWL